MEESPVIQEDPPSVLPLQCVLKEDESSNTQWQNFTEKASDIQNSRLLFLTVEYIHNINNNQEELNNYASNFSENEEVVSIESTLNPSEKYSSQYNTFVNEEQSPFQNSVVVLPSRNNSQQISIIVNESQVPKEFIIEDQKYSQNHEIVDNLKLTPEVSQVIVSSHESFVDQINSDENSAELSQKLRITSTSRAALPENLTIDSVEPNSDVLATSTSTHSFFQGEKEKTVATAGLASSCNDSVQSDFSSSPSDEEVLLNQGEKNENKRVLDPLEYAMNGSRLKEDELLLSDSVQSNELLMKPEGLMDSYNLAQGTYITPDGNSYPTMDEQLNIGNIEKGDSEYLLPDAMVFADTDSSILQSNLEIFTSQVLDTNGSLLYDKSRLRQNKKLPAEHLGLDYWCEDCELGIKCGRHEVKIISDKPVLPRARATLPKELLAINKLHGDKSEEGVFARKTIMRRVQFGPVEGKLRKNWENSEGDSNAVEFLLEVETGHLLKVDVSDEHESNWMRFVRKAKTLKEQNLILTQQGKSLYFTTTRVIPPRHELKVGYSPQYAERRKLAVLEEPSWNCFECTTRFSSSNELQNHLNIHENEKDFNLKPGKKRQRNLPLKGLSNMSRRKGNRSRGQSVCLSNGKEKQCWNCHKIFFRSHSLKRHLMLVHSKKDKENSQIVKTVKGKGEKISVTNTLFTKKQSSGTGSEWLCTHCNLTFDNPSVLNLHTLTHAAEDLESEAVLGLPSDLSSVYHQGEFLIESGDIQCPQCTQEFPSKRDLIDHVSTHGKVTLKKSCSNPSKPYKCDQCYKSFATDTRLEKHMLVHGSEENKPYQCDTCLRRFLNNSALSCHLKSHNVKKSFECPLCKKEFEQVFGLKEHVKSHSVDGFFTCPHCKKVFDGYSVVRKHIRAFHSGHQHICKDCGKLCPTLDKLRMHSLKHSDHREFLCANCGKQFKRKDKLKEHMKRMHSVEREMKLMSLALKIPKAKERRFTPKMSPLAYDRFIYKCRDCMVGFKRRGMLVNHLAKRHPEIIPDTVPELNLPILRTTRDYFCQYCDKIYKSSSKRKAHILKNHPGAQLPLSNRQKGGVPHIPGLPNPTFSQTVGSIKTTPHSCKWCHKQYASKAKLLQHQRKKHILLLPKSQQSPRLSKMPSSPVDCKIMENPGSPLQVVDWKENEKCIIVTDRGKIEEHNDLEITQGTFTVCGEFSQDLDAYKKSTKALPENISSELLHQAMTELSQTLSEYKLPFSNTQDNLMKIIGIKTGGDIITREDSNIPAVQMSRIWPDLPPYPPR